MISALLSSKLTGLHPCDVDAGRLAHRADLSEHAHGVCAYDADFAGVASLCLAVPLDGDATLRLEGEELWAGREMDGDAASASNKPRHVLARYRPTTLRVRHHDVLDAVDQDGTLGLSSDLLEQLGDRTGVLRGLGEGLLRQQLSSQAVGGDRP